MPRTAFPLDQRTCEWCGTPFEAKRYAKTRFCGPRCRGANNTPFREQTRERNARFNHGWSVTEGRTIVTTRTNGWVAYSRVLMMGHLKRELRSDEIVHHVNGDRTDDRIENLQILTRAEHARLHIEQDWTPEARTARGKRAAEARWGKR